MNEAADRRFEEVRRRIAEKNKAANNLPMEARLQAKRRLMSEFAVAVWDKHYHPLPAPELTLQQKDGFKMSLLTRLKFLATGIVQGKKAAEISLLKLYFRPIEKVTELRFQKVPGNVKVAYGRDVMYIISRTGKTPDKTPTGTACRKPLFPKKSRAVTHQQQNFDENTLPTLKSLCQANYKGLLERMAQHSGR